MNIDFKMSTTNISSSDTSTSASYLPKGISPKAKIWAAYVAKNVKAKPAVNPDAVFILGRTLLDYDGFNKTNASKFDAVHGVQVMYGPFSSKQSAQEFVSDYPQEMWPGDNDWRYVYAGQVEILSGYFEPEHADIIHNSSLDFQGQLLMNEQQRRIKEIGEVQERLNKRKENALNGEVKMTKIEVESHIKWQKQRIQQTETTLEQQRKHLQELEKLTPKE